MKNNQLDEFLLEKKEKDYTWLKLLGTICGCILFYFFLINFTTIKENLSLVVSIVTPFIFGLVLSYILNPLLKTYEKLLKKFIKNKKAIRILSLLLSYITLILLVIVFILIVAPKIYASLLTISNALGVQLKRFAVLAEQILENYDLDELIPATTVESAIDFIPKVVNTLLSSLELLLPQIFGITSSLFSFVINIFIGVVVSVYVLTGKERYSAQIKKTFGAWFSTKNYNEIIDFFRVTDGVFNKYMVGQILDAIIVGILCFISMLLLQLSYPSLISVIIAVTNIIPYFGPFIGAIPSVIFLLTVSPQQAAIFVLLIVVLQQIDGNIINPKIQGDSVGLDGIWVTFSITIGGGLFGIPGMILAVPAFAVIYYYFSKITKQRLKNKRMPTETEDYIQKN